MERVLALLTLIMIGACSSEYCPEQYERFSDVHTSCKPDNGQCDRLVDGLDEKYIADILKEHNNYRNKIATGKDDIIDLPPASNMMQMVWDDELAQGAQKHAEQCKFEHDCSECRRVPNFSVGQNLYMDSVSGVKVAPEPNWTAAVKSWYDEIEYFKKSYLHPFVASSGSPNYGHFTQALWGTTWRVGCGYVQYKDGKKFVGLYTCNYGPGGNIKSGRMYEEGKACSKCPINSCCGDECADYPGLCKMLKTEAPRYPKPKNASFFCSFNGEDDCEYSVTDGADKWEVTESLSGNSLGVVLEGGESSTVTFDRTFKGSKGKVCFSFTYSKGPDRAGQKCSSKLVQRYVVEGSTMESTMDSAAANNLKFNMGLGWDKPTKVSLIFSVPEGAPTQFFEVRDLKAKSGDCD